MRIVDFVVVRSSANCRRAYIAASRRSDRSLEARVESARRASEIHKRRTGRSLRVTEQDVVNEEMYEEEDDDLPMQYRRLTAHLQTQSASFSRRFQDYTAGTVGMRDALSRALANSWQNTSLQQSGYNQFMNPNMMQVQQPGFQNPMLPPNMTNRSPTNYRQSPYPVQNMQQGNRQNAQHGRSASAASPHDFANFHPQQQQSQQSQSAQTSPVDNVKLDDRRMSLPAQNMLPKTPQSQSSTMQTASPAHMSPAMTRNSSSSNLASTHDAFNQQHSQSPQQVPTPPQQQQPSFASPFDVNAHYSQFGGMDNFFNMSLPMNTQQLLNTNLDMNEPYGLQQGQPSMKQQQQQNFYSYNPNGKPKTGSNGSMSQSSFDGLNQTLLPSHINTNVSGTESFMSPALTGSDPSYTPYSAQTYGGNNFSFDNSMFTFDPVNASGSTSGHITPTDNELPGSFFDHELYEDVHHQQAPSAV